MVQVRERERERDIFPERSNQIIMDVRAKAKIMQRLISQMLGQKGFVRAGPQEYMVAAA